MGLFVGGVLLVLLWGWRRFVGQSFVLVSEVRSDRLAQFDLLFATLTHTPKHTPPQLVGGFTIPFDILSESHSSSLRRASLVVQINYFWALGAILVPLLEYLNFVLLNKTWRTFVIICSLPSLFALIIGYFVVRESEIWLKTQHKTTDESTISSLSSNSTILNTSSLISERANEIITSLGWYQTISLWMIWFSKSFSYYGMVIVTSRIFSSDDGWDYRRSFFSCGSEVVGTWMTGVLADRVGRIPTMMWSFLLAGVFLLR